MVSSKEHLIVRTPQDFKHDMEIEVYTKHEIIDINIKDNSKGSFQ
ncbi:MAG: hypothetical protein ABDH25_06470 [Dictyoglomaceae bacterium]